MENLNYYEILGVDETATKEEIKNSYRILAKKFHPDTNKGNKMAAEMFKKISEAYETLTDDKKRQMYDASLKNNNNSYQNTYNDNYNYEYEDYDEEDSVYNNEAYQNQYQYYYNSDDDEKYQYNPFFDYDSSNPNQDWDRYDRVKYYIKKRQYSSQNLFKNKKSPFIFILRMLMKLLGEILSLICYLYAHLHTVLRGISAAFTMIGGGIFAYFIIKKFVDEPSHTALMKWDWIPILGLSAALFLLSPIGIIAFLEYFLYKIAKLAGYLLQV